MAGASIEMSSFEPISRTRSAEVVAAAEEMGIGYSVPSIPVLAIAEGLGIDVIFSDFGRFSAQVSGFCDFQSRALYVNADDHIERQMFTIAHELGHMTLHESAFEADPDSYAVFMRYQQVSLENQFEQEANLFADHLLVPKRLLTPVKSAPISELAVMFGVERDLIEKRLRDVR